MKKPSETSGPKRPELIGPTLAQSASAQRILGAPGCVRVTIARFFRVALGGTKIVARFVSVASNLQRPNNHKRCWGRPPCSMPTGSMLSLLVGVARLQQRFFRAPRFRNSLFKPGGICRLSRQWPRWPWISPRPFPKSRGRGEPSSKADCGRGKAEVRRMRPPALVSTRGGRSTLKSPPRGDSMERQESTSGVNDA